MTISVSCIPTSTAGLWVDAVWKQRRIDIDNSHKKQKIVDSRYQKQKAKTKD